MTDEQKVVAVWKSSVSFVYQDAPPIEFLHEGCVHDTIKSFNVYGYGMCCCASARIEQMVRYLGLPARGYGIMRERWRQTQDMIAGWKAAAERLKQPRRRKHYPQSMEFSF